jgi:hydrogenase maturation protease
MSKTLIIGVGNTLRGDDGAGIRVAERAGTQFPDVDVLCVHGLTPELAETVARYDRVIVVDASLTAAGLRVTTLNPESPFPRSHNLSPGGILALSSSLYHRAPGEALLIELPVRSAGFGESLSPGTAGLVDACLDVMKPYVTGR